MAKLRCTMPGHEAQSIQAICYDKNCVATERILCFLCIKQFHAICNINYYTEEEIKYYAKEKFLKSIKEGMDHIESFDKIQHQFKQSIAKNTTLVHKNHLQNKKLLEQANHNSQMKLQSKEQWQQAYQFIIKEAPIYVDETTYMNIMNEYLLEMKESFKQLLELNRSIQFQQEKICEKGVTCNWNEIIVQYCSSQVKQQTQLEKQANQQQENESESESSEKEQENEQKKQIENKQEQAKQLKDKVQEQDDMYTISCSKGTVLCVRCSPDGRCIVSGSKDKTIRVWQVNTKEEQYPSLEGHEEVAYSQNGELILSGSYDKTIRLWNSSDRQCLRQILSPGISFAISISPDGSTFACASNNVEIWDFQGRKIQDINCKNEIFEVCYSPDGNYLAIAKENNQIQIIDLRNLI